MSDRNFIGAPQPKEAGSAVVEVTLKFSKIIADDYNAASRKALSMATYTPELLQVILALGIKTETDWQKAARVAKEADGTYTVTLP